MEGFGFLRGFTGEKSSKRLWALIFGILAALDGQIIFATAAMGLAKDSNISVKVFEIFTVACVSLLGLGLPERFSKK